ncbi:MAG TPA: hypothetical protein VGD60_05250 [Candidatus Acidoferrales bacterium]
MSMLPRRDHCDEDALDVMAGAVRYWMRFFAALRMTMAWGSRSTKLSAASAATAWASAGASVCGRQKACST